MPSSDITGFTDVDTTPDPGAFVATLDELSGGLFAEATEAGAQAMLPEPGQRFLDVGSGTGDFSIALEDDVTPGGEVVGVDLSQAMVDEARRRAGNRPGVRFELGQATELPFDDDSFDGVHMERVMLYVDEPGTAVREIARVTKPGGRVVLVEPDIGTWTIDPGDPLVTEHVVGFFSGLHSCPWAGRALRRLLVEEAAEDVIVTAHTSVLTDMARWASTFRIAELLDRAVAEQAVTPEERRGWWDQLEAADSKGQFWWSATLFVATGVIR